MAKTIVLPAPDGALALAVQRCRQVGGGGSWGPQTQAASADPYRPFAGSGPTSHIMEVQTSTDPPITSRTEPTKEPTPGSTSKMNRSPRTLTANAITAILRFITGSIVSGSAS